MAPARTSHASFALVLAGGGARGFAHAGVLHALDHYGFRPTTIVGISMGAIIGAMYALNPEWYKAVLTAKAPPVLRAMNVPLPGNWTGIQKVTGAVCVLHNLVFGWGLGAGTVEACKEVLRELTLGRSLEEGSPSLSIITTDLLSGQCIVLSSGNAGDAAYASSALAGIFPPLKRADFLLADGGYADLPPAWSIAPSASQKIIMVDPDRYSSPWTPSNGMQAMIRAAEVAMQGHARRFAHDVDFVLCPQFRFPVAAFDFRQRRSACAAGVVAVRRSIDQIRSLLAGPSTVPATIEQPDGCR